jgi:hypothetical protein
MAVTTQFGTEYTSVYQTEPPVLLGTQTWHGRLRGAYVSHVQSGAGDATSSAAVWKIPPGTVRLILPMSYLYVAWTTASATFDLGWDAYTDLSGSAVAADVDGLIDGISVESSGVIGFEELTASAGAGAPATTGYTKVFSSKDGVVIRASSTDTAIADTDALYGLLVYMQD